MNKFKSNVLFCRPLCVLMKDGSKQIINDITNPNIERELNSDEYYEFVQELGFIVGSKISHWDNTPTTLTKIVKGTNGYVQPSFWRNEKPTKEFPNGRLAMFYEHKLVVYEPTEFWHYKSRYNKNNGKIN